MTTMKCKNCSTDIDPTQSNQDQAFIICPTCEAVLSTRETKDDVAGYKPSLRSLPSRMSIKVLDDELVITRRWFGLGHVVLAAVVYFLLVFGLFFSEVHILEFVINPLTWFVAGLGYYLLTRLVNKTVVRASPRQVMIKEGPLPPRRTIRLNAPDIKQLYVKKHVTRNKKSTTTTYQLHLKYKNRRNQQLLSDIESPERALFLEQEIERYLGIKDQPMPNEYESSPDHDFGGWGTFAAQNGLRHTPGKLLEGHRVSGHYHGYAVDLIIVESLQGLNIRTRLILAAINQATGVKDPDRPVSLNDVSNLFAAPLQSGFDLKGQFKRAAEDETWTYEQAEVETDSACLQVVLNTLHNLSEAYPHITSLGGEIIPILQASAADPKHPARAVAAHLIQAIAPTTEHLHQQGEAGLLCPRCLRRCASHEVETSWLSSTVYYGCRNCHQSKEFLTIETVVAVLDEEADSEPVQQGSTLTVNWLARQSLFDFDRVAIVRATDEDVERFVVQVGNDTDPTRQDVYSTIRCVVSPDCRLSDNTMRILQRTFGQVEVTEVSLASQAQTHIATHLLDQEDERFDVSD